MRFELAKAQFNNTNFIDGLRVEISTDCGATFTSIYEKEGSELATVPPATFSWFPTSSNDWRTEEINLAAYQGTVGAIFRVINVGGFGNGTFIDDFNVDTLLAVEDATQLDGVSLYPNPSSSQVTIALPSNNLNQVDINVVNNQGQLIDTIKNRAAGENIQMDVSNYAAGIYFVTINSGNSRTVKKLIVM